MEWNVNLGRLRVRFEWNGNDWPPGSNPPPPAGAKPAPPPNPPPANAPPKPPAVVWSHDPKENAKLTRKYGDPDPMYFDEQKWQWVSGERK